MAPGGEGLTVSVDDLYERYRAMVFRRCLSLLRDREAAKEATQDVFVLIIKALPDFRGDSSPLTWIYRIATTHCLRQLQRGQFLASYVSEQVAVGGPMASAATSEGSLEARNLLDLLAERLDPLCKEILVYTYLDDMTQDEVASLVGRSRKTVGKKLQAIRRHLSRLAATPKAYSAVEQES